MNVNFSCVPAYLKTRAQWMLWKYQRRGETTAKPPVHPHKFIIASATDPENWVPFAEIESIFNTQAHLSNGINYCFSTEDMTVGLDFDHCINAEGVIDPQVMEYVRLLNSYTERSAGGDGLHVFVCGTFPENYRKISLGNGITLEIMHHKHPLVVTGNHLEGTPDDVQERTSELLALYEMVGGKKNGNGNESYDTKEGGGFTGSDDQLIALAKKNPIDGEFFSKIWHGTWWEDYDSPSEADLALCNKIAYWTGRDAERIDRIFRDSALMREKWDEKRGSTTYGERTIAKAIAGLTYWYHPPEDPPPGETPPSQPEVKPKPAEFTLTETGNAERLAQMHGDILRWCQPWKKWVIYDGKRWKVDAINRAIEMTQDVVRSLYDKAKNTEDANTREQIGKFAILSERASARLAVLKLVKGKQPVPLLPEQLDRFPWLLNLSNGTLDLQTGKLRSHDAEDYLTKIITLPYDPAARCPEWEAFLLSIMGGNEEMVDFLWKAIGYSLTGDVREDCLFILYGLGSNGKSTFLSILRSLLGEYGKQAAFSTFLKRENESVRNDLADLAYTRLVVASEAEEGKQLSMALIKALTGRDIIKARFLFAEHFEYPPEMKMWLAANHKPVIRDTTDGAWRRIRLIPFLQSYTDKNQTKDPNIQAKLKTELNGILAWAVRGCLAWQQERLPVPSIIDAATAEYRQESDVIGSFLSEHCILRPGLQVPSADLYARYIRWAEQGKEDVVSQMKLAALLKERGLVNKQNTTTKKMHWYGIALIAENVSS